MFIKFTIMTGKVRSILLILSQLLRFVIWSLMLLNFMGSAATLITMSEVKFTMQALKIFVVMGISIYVTYGVALLIEGELISGHNFDCHSMEFIVQNSLLTLLIIIFYYFAYKVN